MSLTYHDVMHTDLSRLHSASKAWKQMSNKFGTLATNYTQHVAKAVGNGLWQGQGAQAFGTNSDITAHEYAAAKAEALAISKILDDAYGQFKRLKKTLQHTVSDAKEKGYKVNDQSGEVSFDWDKATPEERHAMSKNSGGGKTVGQHEREWTDAIKRIVQQVDDADQGVKLALETAVTDKDGKGAQGGFNSAAVGDVEKVEARRARHLANKIRSGDELSAQESAEFRRLERDNSGSEVYSKTLLNGLGTKGTIELTNSLNGLVHDQDYSGSKGDLLAIRQGLANTLGTATKDTNSRFYQQWRADMKKTGLEQYKGSDAGLTTVVGAEANKVRGYQSLLTLLEQGDPKGYSPQMLQNLGHDLRAAEDPSKGGYSDVWDLHGRFAGKNEGWFANDPLDSTLGIMSHQPDTATEFLDPGPGKKNDMLHYLIKDRDWEFAEKLVHPHPDLPGQPKSIEDPDSRTGLGAALQAGATGHEPGTHQGIGGHTESQARIMHETVDTLNAAGQAEKMPENLRRPVANMLVDYTPDTHEILSRENRLYDKHDGPWQDSGETHLSMDERKLVKAMRGVADDPAAFGDMYKAEKGYSSALFSKMPDAINEHTRTPIQGASSAMGMYDGVRADITFDNRDNSVQWARDFNHQLTSTSGALLNFVPGEALVGADITNRAVDFTSYDIMNDRINEAGLKATRDNDKQFMAGQEEVDDMVASWAETHEHEQDSDFTRDLMGLGQTKHKGGRDQALNHLRADYS